MMLCRFFFSSYLPLQFVTLFSQWTLIFISIVSIRFETDPEITRSQVSLGFLSLSLSFCIFFCPFSFGLIHSIVVRKSIQLLWIDQFNLVCINIVAIKLNQVTTINTYPWRAVLIQCTLLTTFACRFKTQITQKFSRKNCTMREQAKTKSQKKRTEFKAMEEQNKKEAKTEQNEMLHKSTAQNICLFVVHSLSCFGFERTCCNPNG